MAKALTDGNGAMNVDLANMTDNQIKVYRGDINWRLGRLAQKYAGEAGPPEIAHHTLNALYVVGKQLAEIDAELKMRKNGRNAVIMAVVANLGGAE